MTDLDEARLAGRRRGFLVGECVSLLDTAAVRPSNLRLLRRLRESLNLYGPDSCWWRISVLFGRERELCVTTRERWSL